MNDMNKEHSNQKDCPNCGDPMAWKNLEKDRCLKCDPFPEDSPSRALMNPAISAELLSENRKLRQRITAANADSVQVITNNLFGELPEVWMVTLVMENGAGWVEAIKPSGFAIDPLTLAILT